MFQVILAPEAVLDFESILTWTQENFGSAARVRYEKLLEQSISDIAKCPDMTGSRIRLDLAADIRTYHLRHSRKHVNNPAQRVKAPRHFIVYRFSSIMRQLEIIRILHDHMEVKQHINTQND